jgi:hypothetical protein
VLFLEKPMLIGGVPASSPLGSKCFAMESDDEDDIGLVRLNASVVIESADFQGSAA